MSERIHHSPEKLAAAPEVTVERPKVEAPSAAEQAQHVERAQAIVAAEASNAERPQVPQTPVDDRPQLIDNAVKRFRMRRNLDHVQSRLKPSEKSLSKVVHQPLVSRASEVAAKTASRPSGMLGGGIVAFVGSVLYLTLAYRIGFTYNYLLFLGFFVGGFLLGVAVEYTIYGLRRVRNRS